MRNFKIVIALLFLATSNVASAGEPIEVIIFAGQSNMVGKGLIKNAPTSYQAMPETIEFHAWGSNAKMEKFDNNFGPELSFASALSKQNPGKKYIFVKWAVGGTSQAEWSPSWRLENMQDQKRAKRLGSLYKKSLTFIREALGDRDVNVTGLLWMQGEADTKDDATARRYGDNMKRLIAAWRQDLAAPQMKVIMGLVNPKAEKYTSVAIVQSQMKQLATQDPLVDVISAEDLSKLSDNVHYDEAGLIGLGERFGKKWQEMAAQ